MENYFAAKARLIGELLVQSSKMNRVAIWNGDDPELASREAIWRERMRAAGVEFWSLGRELRAEVHRADLSGTYGIAHTPVGEVDLQLPLPGAHNLANALGALGVAIAAQRSRHGSVDLSAIARALRSARAPRGRLERVLSQAGRHVFVDYAHTDDAIRSVMGQLARVAGLPKPRLILVFGCGGDRDRGKRPLMMKAACETSDLVVLTSDNPRGENPQQIIEEAYAGRSGQTPVHREVDRRAAIRWALHESRPGDVVVIAGKGHERTQEIAGVKHDFDDVQVAMDELRELESRK
jgi:UDP-N-acetylmuramyl-tripeptide synthetase